MTQPLRIENPETVSFITTRTRGSALWFVRCRSFEKKVLGYLAKYQRVYGVLIYAFVFQGNHYHLIARFPRGNRAAFMRDFNSICARLCTWHIEDYDGGGLWARRYAEQALPNNEDIEERVFYCALQPVLAGLCEHPSEYESYNSFQDAISGTARAYLVTDWVEYNNVRRTNPFVSIKQYQKRYVLQFSRMPGYESLSQREYQAQFAKKLESRRQQAVRERKKKGLGFCTKAALSQTVRGAKPNTTKTSKRTDRRPLVLTKCANTKLEFLAWYFSIKEAFDAASKCFRQGALDTLFPPGTYRPMLPCAP